MRIVCETLHWLLTEALKYYPQTITWLKTKGDLELGMQFFSTIIFLYLIKYCLYLFYNFFFVFVFVLHFYHPAIGNNEAAMRCYVNALITGTDYCTFPLQRNVADDYVIHKMIRCSSNLGCHMQATVLCQVNFVFVEYL